MSAELTVEVELSKSILRSVRRAFVRAVREEGVKAIVES